MNSRLYPELTDAVNDLMDALQEELGDEFDIIDEFTDRTSAMPLSKPTATVGLGDVTSESVWFNDYLGRKNGTEVYGNCIHVTYLITIHSPITCGGDACRTFACKLRDAVYNGTYLRVGEIASGEIHYDRSRRCLYLPLTLKAKYIA